jgi:hypothetical protein
MLRRRVIERELLASRDIAPCKKQHVTVLYATEAVRVARVIDVSGRVAAAARIDAPAAVDLADPHFATSRHAARCFAIADPFADEFADFAARSERHCGKTAFAVDPGAADNERRRSCCDAARHFAAG